MTYQIDTAKVARFSILVRSIVILFVLLVVQIPQREIINKQAVYILMGIAVLESIIYEAVVRWREDFVGLLNIICAVDVIMVAFLVAYTGGINSTFYLLYLLPLIFSAFNLDVRNSIFFGILVSTSYLFNMLLDIENILLSTYYYLFATRLPLFWGIVILGTFISLRARTVQEELAEKKKQLEETRVEASKYSAFYKTTSKIFSSLLDLEKILRFVVEKFAVIANMERCTVMFIDEKSGDMVAHISNKIPLGELKWFMIKKDEDLFHWIVENKRPIIIADPKRYRGIAEDFCSRYKIGTMITLPLEGDEKVIGAIHLDSLDEESIRRISDEELEQLQGLAKHIAIAIENVRAYELASKQKRLIEQTEDYLAKLFRFSADLTASHQLPEVLTLIDEMVVRFIGAAVYRLMIFGENGTLEMVKSRGVHEGIKLNQRVIDEVISTGNPFLITDASSKDILNKFGTDVLLCLPLKSHDKPIGALEIRGVEDGRTIDSEGYAILLIAANLMAIAIENAQLYHRISYISIIDGLTGLYNYAYFKDRLTEEIARCSREQGRPFSLIMADIDYFKSLNAIYGHHLGDRVLSEIANIFKNYTRKVDLGVRYGGDEIALLLANTPKEGATILANRLCQGVREYHLMVGNTRVPLTVSIGVVTFPEDGVTKEELVNAAEKGIQKAREMGRNQVYVLPSTKATVKDKLA